ncbi:thioredoxin family protein [Haliscomenobacter sp.]|uniref:thioredoxin family protein n=1 Tax=Haliscomenobacter sp. TaxID=2717303 RepID=UPI0035935602
MKKLSLLRGLLLVLTLLTASQKLHAVQFARLSLAEAKARAAQLQRPLLIHFAANWCLPCQWMDKNTFVDPEVLTYLSNQYLAVKIDVDEVQGYADKEACGVKYLPSLLIFNATGIVVSRYEETLDAAQMLEVLRKYDTPANRIAPRSTYAVPTVKINTPSNTVAQIDQSEIGTISADVENDPAHLDAQRLPIGQTNAGPALPSSRKMGIQVGVYSSYENVIRQVQYFEKKFYKAVQISAQTKNGQTYYHLIAGPFETPAQMQTYLIALQRDGLKGLIVTL